MTTGCFADSFDDDENDGGRRHTKGNNVSIYDQLKKMMATLDDETYARMVRDIDAEKKRGKPSLREGAALWEQSKDEGMRIPGATRPASGDDLSRVARPQDQTPPASRVGGMNIPRGASPERLAQLLRAAEPGDWFRIDGDQAQNIDLSQ